MANVAQELGDVGVWNSKRCHEASMARTHPLIRAGDCCPKSVEGVLGERARSPDRQSSGRIRCAWLGVGGEASLQVQRVGSKGLR